MHYIWSGSGQLSSLKKNIKNLLRMRNRQKNDGKYMRNQDFTHYFFANISEPLQYFRKLDFQYFSELLQLMVNIDCKRTDQGIILISIF